LSGKKRILVTSALPYANGPIHLGHLAGAYLPADIFVRYHRLNKKDIIFICGSDEHGVPILLRARKENVSPQEIVDRYHERNKNSFHNFGINFDYYGRTSSKVHHETSQEFFRTLAQKENFVLKTDEQLYDSEAKIFLADRFVRGECPNCQFPEAYGDQCEKCGSSLSPMDLVNPRSAITNSKPVLKKSTHWYLPLAKFQPELEKWVKKHPEWKTNVLGQIRSWFDQGLKDRAVTRDLPWGVEIPKDVAQRAGVEADGKVLYVWFDAPIGYISATKEWAAEKGNPDLWKEYWQRDDTRLIHFIGKDNIVFHCIIFPAMLHAHGDYVLPENVPANEFLNLEGDKLSTSRNYAVWLEDYLNNFEPDSLRYCLASNLPETKDSDFSWKDFQARNNNELADILGNFINRTLTFCAKNFDGCVPTPGKYDTEDKALINTLKTAPDRIGKLIDSFLLRQAVKEMMDVTRFANKYFNDKKPWESIKNNRDKCATTIYLALETVKSLSILFDPIIPFTGIKIREILNLEQKYNPEWSQSGILSLKPGHKLKKPQIIFKKIENEEIERELDKLKLGGEEKIAPESNTVISIDDFKKVDLIVAEICSVEPVKKADRLLKMTVDIGPEKRQIIAGIAKHYKVDQLIGKKIVIVKNLAPAKIKGEVSRGMLLAAKSDDELCLLTVDGDLPNGAKIS
jgi:methionyl-tRNA synthetase